MLLSTEPWTGTMKISPIRHTWSGDFAIGYQTVGDGPIDLVYASPWASNLDWNWRWDHHARFLRRLGSFSRLILFDPRGWGVSDRLPPGAAPSLKELAADMIAVLDTLNLGAVALFASNEGSYVGLFAAATFPERISHLVLFHGSPVFLRTDDLPWELTPDSARSLIEQTRKMPSVEEWSRQFVRDALPSHADDEQALEWFATMLRVTEAPGSVSSHIEAMTAIDLRDVLPRIAAPTLVLHRKDLRGSSWRIESSRYVVERIPNASLVELAGSDIYPWGGNWEPAVAEIQRFLTGGVEAPRRDIAVATVLFTDIVNSTAQAATLGDHEWTQRRLQHDGLVRSELRSHHGREIDTAGDGFLATFGTPGEALRCATAIVDRVHSLGLEIRAGVHTGEVELDGDAVRGIAVHIGARISSLANANEVWVSQTVRDMVAGSEFTFHDMGVHELKGVPDSWRLYRST